MTTWANFYLQDSASLLMGKLIFFHDHALIILTMITVLEGYLLSMLFFNKYTNRFLQHGQTIEVIWTILPAIVLLFPSLWLLYLFDEINEQIITLKLTISHQWYWSYEYSNFMDVEFD